MALVPLHEPPSCEQLRVFPARRLRQIPATGEARRGQQGMALLTGRVLEEPGSVRSSCAPASPRSPQAPANPRRPRARGRRQVPRGWVCPGASLGTMGDIAAALERLASLLFASARKGSLPCSAHTPKETDTIVPSLHVQTAAYRWVNAFSSL